MESLQNCIFEVNNPINSNLSLCQGDITKINIDAIVNAASEIFFDEKGLHAGAR